MNKIIIVGNGFDIAHGLKTSYKDLMGFIKEETTNVKPLKKCSNNHIHHYFNGKQNPYISFVPDGNRSFKYKKCPDSKSIYFSKLFTHYELYNNWIDLESLYFNLLKEHQNKLENISIINKEFDYLKQILEKYLTDEIESKLPDDNRKNTQLKNTRFDVFNLKNEDHLLAVINFNYTTKAINYNINNLSSWCPKNIASEFSVVNIHGELNNAKNPIIFGYGDDNSQEYKTLQDKENETLLKNFKTFQYLRNNEYHKTLGLLENNIDIKIEIIGHSCGLSDKTLLRTIFQHPKVKKIEYRYHTNEDKYFENLYNISRIFDNNELMREKLVSLSDTEIIPQISI